MAVPASQSVGRPVTALAALAALGTASFCYVTGEELPVGLLPSISAGVGASLSATGLLVTVYALVVVVASAPLTHLTHLVPRRFLLSGLLGWFVLTTLAAAAAPSYGWLLVARVLTAASQAVFWSIAAVTAAGLFRPEARGRAIAGVFAGSSLAVVVGIPAGTWVGQEAGWRVPFVALAVLGALSLVAVAFLLPTTKPAESHAAAGTHPDARRYRMLVLAVTLAVAGFFTPFTYISPFLTRVSGLASHDVAAVLLVAGLASTFGVAASGVLHARRPEVANVLPFGLLAAGMFSMYALGTSGFVAAAAQAVESLAFGGMVISMQTQVLVVAPRNTDIASAWYSAAFNVGIGGGPLIGGALLSSLGLRATPLVGGLLVSLALVVAISELRVAGRGRPVGDGAVPR